MGIIPFHSLQFRSTLCGMCFLVSVSFATQLTAQIVANISLTLSDQQLEDKAQAASGPSRGVLSGRLWLAKAKTSSPKHPLSAQSCACCRTHVTCMFECTLKHRAI